ncbi:MAG: VOC family protein [Rhizobiaceae bacterium]|nr:VOC family protein [Rhizobiaceae bacterium]
MSAGFIWHELMTSDPAAAKAFYAAVLGWTPEPFPGTGMDYTVVKAGERGVGGIMPIPEAAAANGMPPAWLGYIRSHDIDADVAALKKAGGNIHRGPQEIGEGVGSFAVVSDPQGAMYMMLEPEGPDQPPAAPMTPGHVGWNELLTDNWEEAFDYYSGLYGWTKSRAIDMQDMGVYQLVAVDGTDMGAMMNRPPQIPVSWGFYFIVDGLDAAVKRVTDNGGKITMEPMEVPGGQWVANCTDAQGAHFGMVSNTK